MQQLTKIILAWELFETGVPKLHIANQLDLNRDTIRLWIKAIEDVGLETFLDEYSQAKKGARIKRQVDPLLKSWVWEIRDREMDCCGQKIIYFLKREHGVKLALSKVYEILAEKYILKSKWKKNQARGPVPEAGSPREVIQMDTVDFGYLFVFTAIDIFTKEVVVKLYQSLTANDGLDFLQFSFNTRFSHTNLLQTDGGSEFKAEFRSNVFHYASRFRVARPYKKNEQSYIESFNRSLRKECLGWSKYTSRDLPYLEKELIDYLWYYHNKRVHIGLGMKTPNEFLGVSDF